MPISRRRYVSLCPSYRVNRARVFCACREGAAVVVKSARAAHTCTCTHTHTHTHTLLQMQVLSAEEESKPAEDSAMFCPTDKDGDGSVAYTDFLSAVTKKLGARVVPGLSVHLHRCTGLQLGPSFAKPEPQCELCVRNN
jgi:hypothetical protein